MAEELRRIAKLVEQGYQSGEVHGGWWDLSGEFAEPDYEQIARDNCGIQSEAEDGGTYWHFEHTEVKADAKLVTAEGFCIAHDLS